MIHILPKTERSTYEMRATDAATMHAIHVNFQSKVELAAALAEENALFVAGKYTLPIGAPVFVRVRAAGMRGELMLEGMVRWRRVQAGGARGAMQPGIGIQILPGQQQSWTFLRRWADGNTEESGRGESRYPVRIPCVLSDPGRQTKRMLHATVNDVSQHGARITVPAPLTQGATMVLELLLDGRILRMTGRVAWSTESGAGLRLALEQVRDRDLWEQIVRSARDDLEKRVVEPTP